MLALLSLFLVILRHSAVEIRLLALLSLFLVIVLPFSSFSSGALIIIIVFPVTTGEQLQADCGRSPQSGDIPLLALLSLFLVIVLPFSLALLAARIRCL